MKILFDEEKLPQPKAHCRHFLNDEANPTTKEWQPLLLREPMKTCLSPKRDNDKVDHFRKDNGRKHSASLVSYVAQRHTISSNVAMIDVREPQALIKKPQASLARESILKVLLCVADLQTVSLYLKTKQRRSSNYPGWYSWIIKIYREKNLSPWFGERQALCKDVRELIPENDDQ